MFQIKRFAWPVVIQAFMWLGSTPAWAGPGDIDPNYGAGGALKIGAESFASLPGNRLAIFGGGGVRMVDASGQVVSAYGVDGQAAIPAPADTPYFFPWGAAPGADGRLLVYGILQDAEATRVYEALYLLDAAGHGDPAFGGNDDGFLRVGDESIAIEGGLAPAELVGYALDSTGRIVLLERTVNLEGACQGPALLRRLLPDGAADESFGTGGEVQLASIDLCTNGLTFGVRADESIVVGRGTEIFSIDATGHSEAAFGEAGRLSIGTEECCTGFLLPDGGLVLLGSVPAAHRSTDSILMRFDRHGHPDSSLGAGSGAVTIDLAAEFGGAAGSDAFVERVMLSPGDSGLLLQLSAGEIETFRRCFGIAKLAADGKPDAGFGDHGLACLSFGGYRFDLVAVQENGAAVFSIRDPHNGTWTSVHRLLADAMPSPGIITVSSGDRATESAGATATVTIARVAGRDGAVSIGYATADRAGCHIHFVCLWDSASTDSDYMPTSGRFDWPDGDGSTRTVTIHIRDDDKDEYREIFGIDFATPQGGAQIFESGASVFIDDDDAAAVEPPPLEAGTGGGGPVSWMQALGLLALLLIRRIHNQQQERVMATRIAGMLVSIAAASPALAQTFPPLPAAHQGATVTVLASGLHDPRGLALGPNGSLYVAEAGTTEGVFTVPPGPPVTDLSRDRCVMYWPVAPIAGGYTGRVSRISARGHVKVVADELPSVALNTLIGGDRSSAAAVAMVGTRLYALVSGAGCSHGHPSEPNGIYRIYGDGVAQPVVDLSNLLRGLNDVKDANDPTFEPDGSWYSMIHAFGSLYAVEPNRGAFVRVNARGEVTVLADLIDAVNQTEGDGDQTWTTLARRDDHFYIGTLGRIDTDFAGAVYRLSRNGSRIRRVVSGLHGVLGIAFDTKGRMYVLETTAPGVDPPLSDPAAGRLVRVERDGSLTPILTGLAFPTALIAGRDGAFYVTNCGYGCNDRSSFPAALPSLRAGQVLKVKLRGGDRADCED